VSEIELFHCTAHSTLYRRATRHVLTRVAKCIYVDGGILENVLLHVRPLLGNVLFSKFPRRQILGKQSVARLRNNKWGSVFYVVCADQRWNNGVMQSVSKQRLGTHFRVSDRAMKAVTSSTIDTVFSVGPAQSAYKRSDRQTSFRGQLRGSRKLEE
jgi:hypothetical protein